MISISKLMVPLQFPSFLLYVDKFARALVTYIINLPELVGVLSIRVWNGKSDFKRSILPSRKNLKKIRLKVIKVNLHMPSPHSSSNVRTRKEKAAARYCNGDGANGQQEKSSEPQWVYFFLN